MIYLHKNNQFIFTININLCYNIFVNLIQSSLRDSKFEQETTILKEENFI